VQEQIDRVEIEAVYHRERLARDMQRWDDLAACYHDDSYIDISWFQGSGAEFAKACAGMGTKVFSFHEVGSSVTEVHGSRALTDTGIMIHLISQIDGIEVDCVGYCRSRARMERKTDKWLMSGFRAIYVHDWLTPVNPARVPKIDEAKLNQYRRSYRFLSYILEGRGLPVRDDLPGVDKPETVDALLAGERGWLHGAGTD
jgi:hypothetical protein